MFILVAGALAFLTRTLYIKGTQPKGNFVDGKLYNLNDEANNALKTPATAEDSFLFFLQKGFGASNSGDWSSAEHYFVAAQAIKPEAALVYSVLCQTQIQLRKYDEAITSAKYALKLKPDYTVAKYYLEMAEKRKSGIEDWN